MGDPQSWREQEEEAGSKEGCPSHGGIWVCVVALLPLSGHLSVQCFFILLHLLLPRKSSLVRSRSGSKE